MSWIIKSESDQLKMGIVVEKEHADTIKWLAEKLGGEANEGLVNEVAAKIAEDHLKEMPDYYSKLKEMESKPAKQASANEFHKNLKERLGQ